MGALAWFGVRRTPWNMLRVQRGDPALPTTLTGPARLVALYQWRQGRASAGVRVIESSPAHAKPRSEDIDWVLFPIVQAQREMIEDEVRCAQVPPRRSPP